MSRRDLDTYVGETARVGEAMGVENPPRSWAEMHAAIEGHRPNLAVGEQAALGLGFLEHPPFLPPAARPVWRLLWSGAVAVQPPVSKLLLRLEEPAERDVAGCRALVRAMGRVLGEPPSYARARQRATGRQPTA